MSEANSSPARSDQAAPTMLVPAERTFIFPKENAAALLQAACYIKPDLDGYWTPAPADLAGAEVGLEKFLAEEMWMSRHSWTAYYRQVAGLEQEAGRSLFISYFVPEFPPPLSNTPGAYKGPVNSPERWKREPYWMNDGGDTYFRVVYDPAKKQFTWFERNTAP